MIFNSEVEDEILLQYKDNLYKEIDLCVIYGRMSYSDAVNLSTIRRKIFINNFNYFKSMEHAQAEDEIKNRTIEKKRLSFN